MNSILENVPIILRGAPDHAIGLPAADSKSIQVMQLDMSNDVLEELLASTRMGKQPQISFGRTPMLRFSSRSLTLDSRPVRHRPEIYRANDEEKEWDFAGLVSHSLSIEKVKDPSEGLDEALAVLKNNMASIGKERDANKTITPSSLKASATNSHLSASQKKSTVEPTAMPSTSTGHIDWAIKHRTPAIRHALVHLLALEPQTLKECALKVGAYKEVIKPILEKIATEDANGKWEMGNRGYKELDPHIFRYKKEQRSDVIEKAIKAFDRLRIDPKDPLWQKLLPAGERNKGTILSRLFLQPSQGTPSMKPITVDKKTGLPKKQEPKKTADTKPKEKNAGKSSPLPCKEAKSTVGNGRSDSPLLKTSTKNKLANKSSKLASSPASRPTKEVKASTAAKSMLNRPRNPSPLSKSPPVNASDFEETHPVHRSFSSAPSPSKNGSIGSMKRKATQDIDRPRESSNKKARVDTLLSVSKAKSSTNLKRKADDHSSSSIDSTPLKMRKMGGSSADNARQSLKASSKSTAGLSAKSNRPRSSTQVSDDSSVTSPDYVTSHSKRLEMAEDFKRYYVRYERYHQELSARTEAPSKEQMAMLMKMHNRVADMKKQLAAA